MLSPIQKFVGLIPLFFVIIALTMSFITQKIWIRRKYIFYFLVAILYSFFSLWIFKFDFSQFGFKISLVNFIYLAYCFLFEKIFLKIKPKHSERIFPIYIIFDWVWPDIWDKKITGKPQSSDRIVSGGLAVTTIFTIIGLMIFVF